MDAALRELEAELGGEVVTLSAIPERYWNDWAGLDPVRPAALLRPREPREVARALAICNRHRLAVVPQGGRTGLAGGARPSPGCAVLALERLAGVEEVDGACGTMTVRAGTVLEEAQRVAAEAELFLPLDLGARGSCQIGGNLATNAGGTKVIRYGMARDLTLGLEVALADGTLLTGLNKLVKNNAGFDLKQLFIGCEGTLGIITRAVLRLQPRPLTTAAAFCGLRDFEAVIALLRRARRELGGLLSAFEVMWPNYYELMATQVPELRLPLRPGHGVYLLLEAQGYEAERDEGRFLDLLEALLEAGGIGDAVVARSARDVRDLWAIRDAVAEFPRILGRHVNFDLGLEVERMQRFADACLARLEKRFAGIRAVLFGHVGDGNLHVVTDLPPGVTSAEVEDLVYRAVAEFGGTISAEHGIGTIKKPYLPLVRPQPAIATMKALKRTLDPHGILNPGKVIDL